jgi:phenylpropionate dioxygenase-like ring-hydroxylating dioxygenase large terminal subunit
MNLKVDNLPFSGYHSRAVPAEDPELTHVGPGTPCGEYLRKFWQPVDLSRNLTDLPHAIRILGEDLVAFRDFTGRVGVLHRHCSHRGTSLEFGIVSEQGLRCCYHGWLYAVDGKILETPGEPPTSRVKDHFHHGAYPALEYGGLVFAYMGPPEEKPEFPIFDTFRWPRGNRIIPYSIHHPCNWLQVWENFMDPIHAVFLHTRLTNVQFTQAWGEMPTVDFGELDDGMYYINCRRVGPMIWIRSNHLFLPNVGQVAALWEDADREKYFNRASITRWTVPIDDTHCWIFGLRHFNAQVDPKGLGKEDELGNDCVDFFGQTGGRPYEEKQRTPGDYDAQVAQRPIAIHALEHKGATDEGVVRLRRLIRKGIHSTTRHPQPADKKRHNGVVHTYTHDTVLNIPMRPDMDDRAMMKEVGRKVLQAIFAGDRHEDDLRQAEIERGLKGLVAEYTQSDTAQRESLPAAPLEQRD